MKYFLLLGLLFFNSFAFADEDKAIISRGEDKDLSFKVNKAGTLTEAFKLKGDIAGFEFTEGDLATISNWTPTTKKYRWLKVGNVVHLWWHVSGGPSTSTVHIVDFPATAPIPVDMPNQLSTTTAFSHTANCQASNIDSPATNSRNQAPFCGIAYNAGVRKLYLRDPAGGALNLWMGYVTYLTAN